jgi:hypothetical protein
MQYSTNDDKVSMGIKQVNVKNAQTCLLGQKIQERETRVGENLCSKWVAASQAQDTYQNKICKKNHYV